MRLLLLTARLPPAHCGVGDYTQRLGEALRDLGHEVIFLEGISRWGVRDVSRIVKEVRAVQADRVLLQWAPHLYHRRGMGLGVPLAVRRLSELGSRVDTVVHELWGTERSLLHRVQSAVQRASMALLVGASEQVWVTVEAWTALLKDRYPRKYHAIHWLPVGPTVIPVAGSRSRERLGIPEGIPTIAVFSPLGAGKEPEIVDKTYELLSLRKAGLAWAVIGVGKEEAAQRLPRMVQGDDVHFSGYLPANEISRWLSASDIFFSPFIDGVSARRTSVISALAHGLPVVTNTGPLSDGVFSANNPLVTVPREPLAFADAIRALAADAERRAELGRRGLVLVDAHFRWDRIARAVAGESPALGFGRAEGA